MNAFRMRLFRCLETALVLAMLGLGIGTASGQATFRITPQTNREAILTLNGIAGRTNRIETSGDLAAWHSFVTFLFPNNGSNQVTDSSAPFGANRYFRAVEIMDTNVLAGDHFQTDDGELTIRPVNHASFVIKWKDLWIYNDPVGAASLYQTFPRADLILVSHEHGDHFSASTLAAVQKPGTVILSPRLVFNSLTAALKPLTTVLSNGVSTNVFGLTVEAVPAYNGNHPKGNGNGYVVTIGGKRLYMAGDTGNTAEMRALQNIDVAFLCMNVPFTMTINDSLAAIRAFKPKIVYPYHFRNQDNSLTDLVSLKRQLGIEPGSEVRIRKWY